MDDTARGVGDEAMRGRGDDSSRNFRDTPGRPAPAGTPGATPPPAGESARTATGDQETDQRTREIRAEIEQTRADMSETIDAIQERLRPGNIVSDATERVKKTATERVKNMVGSASEGAQGAMEQTRRYAGGMAEGAKHNAIPLAMVGAGVVWLLIDRFRRNGREDEYRRYRSAYRTPAYDESDEYYRSAVAGRAGASAYDEDYPGAPGGGERMSERYERTRSRLGGTASHTRERAMRAGRRTRNQVQRMITDNPLLVGAAAMMLGVALGLALPETERENELMGDARDSVVDRAQDMARNAATRAQDAAGEAASEVASRVVTGKESNQ